MPKIRIIKDHGKLRKGQVIDVNERKAKELIAQGVASADKMLSDWKHG